MHVAGAVFERPSMIGSRNYCPSAKIGSLENFQLP